MRINLSLKADNETDQKYLDDELEFIGLLEAFEVFIDSIMIDRPNIQYTIDVS